MSPRFPAEVIISPEVLFQEVGGEAVILDLKGEQYFGLNDVGTRLWDLLSSNHEVEYIFEQLLNEYDVDASQLEADINELLKELSSAGLLEIVND